MEPIMKHNTQASNCNLSGEPGGSNEGAGTTPGASSRANRRFSATFGASDETVSAPAGNNGQATTKVINQLHLSQESYLILISSNRGHPFTLKDLYTHIQNAQPLTR